MRCKYMLQCYNHSTLEIKHVKADSVAIKGKDVAVKVYDLINGAVSVDTSEYEVGDYLVQFFSGDDVIEQTELTVKQNLKYVSADYDPRSKAKITLDAIEAYLSGVATHQQRKVRVGDKQIEFSSYDELMKWRDFYASEVRKEEGKAATIKHQKLYYKGL